MTPSARLRSAAYAGGGVARPDWPLTSSTDGPPWTEVEGVGMTKERGGAGRGRVSVQAIASSDGNDLVVQLSRLARSLQAEDDVDTTLHAIARAAITTIPGAEEAGISVVHRRREIETRAVTAEVALEVDRIQYDTGQGPCLDAIH